jgi:hypothetical protein
VSLASQGRDVARAAPPRNPDAIPLSTAEGNQIARGVVELLVERVEALEDQFRAFASVFDVGTLLGDPPQDGPGLRYLRSRIAQVDAGIWGERGIDKFLEQQAEARRRPILDPAEMAEALLRKLIFEETQKLGGRVSAATHGPDARPGGAVWWPPRHDDPEGRKRGALARQRAEQRLAEHKTAQQNGAKHD